jgi:hypothetical protein
MYFFWYPSSQKAYRVYDLTIRQFFTSGDVVFYENTFSFSTPTPSNYLPSTSIPTVSPDFNDIPIPSSTSHSSLETSISPLSPSSHNFSPSLSNPTHTLSLFIIFFFFKTKHIYSYSSSQRATSTTLYSSLWISLWPGWYVIFLYNHASHPLLVQVPNINYPTLSPIIHYLLPISYLLTPFLELLNLQHINRHYVIQNGVK